MNIAANVLKQKGVIKANLGRLRTLFVVRLSLIVYLCKTYSFDFKDYWDLQDHQDITRHKIESTNPQTSNRYNLEA